MNNNIEVVLSDTDKTTGILVNTYVKDAFVGNPLLEILTALPKETLEARGYKFKYMHILSNEPINVGDWCVSLMEDILPFRCDTVIENNKVIKKIIASTDPIIGEEIPGEFVQQHLQKTSKNKTFMPYKR